MNDDELEARLERWQPADAPPELLRNLRAALPTAARTTGRWSWPLAYAALSTAWIVILALWLTTPQTRSIPAAGNVARAEAIPADGSAPTSALAMERSFLARNNPDQL